MAESEAARAARYERDYAETGISAAQAAERQERADIRSRDYSRRRRYHLMPAMPWHKEQPDA